MKILITGRPGVGKTSLIKRLSARVGGCGFYTEEIKRGGVRVGFDGVNLLTGERVIVARKERGFPRVGKYRVYLDGVESMIVWLKECRGRDPAFVDEIGPIELTHPSFGPSILEVARKSRVFIGTVHRNIAKEWRDVLGTTLVWITEENREEIFNRILSLLLPGN